MKRYFILNISIFICLLTGFAQSTNFSSTFGLSGAYIAPGNVPFWMRSNQFGSVPIDKTSLSLIGSTRKDYDLNKSGIFDWGASFEGRLNVGYKSNATLVEVYGKMRISIFEFKAGRVKEITGLCDTTLSSGSWSISGNALGVPKVQLAIPDFYTLPIFGKLFAVKGSFMHGWLGNWHINDEFIPNTPTYLHQKTLYGKFGKPEWKWKLYAGFNHQVIWGNEESLMGEDYKLSLFQTFIYINTGKAYSNESIQRVRVGNHLGSIDLGMAYEFKHFRLLVYRQNTYDAGALYYFANILDGLNGLSILNSHKNDKNIQWRRLLIELLYTKNQAGESWSRITPSPYENYYNSGNYKTGWSYRGMGLGNPFISPSGAIKEGLPIDTGSFFANNRVIAIHFGLEGYLYGWNITSKLSYSRNYGIYKTSATGKIYPGGINPSTDGIFPETGQFSGFIEIKRSLQKGYRIGMMTALDIGNLLNYSTGLMVSISKTI